MVRLARLGAMAVLLVVPAGHGADEESAILTIRFLDHGPSFHAGEVIPLELAFTASGSEIYQIGLRNYDRSGRLNMEQFHVTPAGRDPLKDYYARGVFIGGGLEGSRDLNDEPHIIHDNLNEWIALDNPGHYVCM